MARMRYLSLLLAFTACTVGASCKEDVTIAPGTNAVRCECECGVSIFKMSRVVEVCIGRDIEPSAVDFSAEELTSFCVDVCSGGVQAQAQESLVAEDVIDDACAASCDLGGVPEGLNTDKCRAPDGERVECAAERCPVDLPGDPALVRYYLLRCTQVVDDSRASDCGPERPTKPLCVIDVGDGDVEMQTSAE